MECYIVKDLLANHVDGLNSDETKADIIGHLESCADCRAVYERMSAALPNGDKPEDKDADFLKKLKARILRKNVAVAVSVCFAVLVGLSIFSLTYRIPLPFDEHRMTVEVSPMAIVNKEDGSAEWWWLDSRTGRFDISPTGYDYTVDMVRVAHHGLGRIGNDMIGRNIKRDGEDIWVVYYNYTKTLWTSLFYDYDLSNVRVVKGHSSGTDIYGDKYQRADYEPQMREIYYLPIGDLNVLENLSDEEFDARRNQGRLRERGKLVWSGVV